MIDHKKEFEEEMRKILIRRLERMTKLVKLNAPDPILDQAFDLVYVSCVALLDDCALRTRAMRIRDRAAISAGRCQTCYAPLDQDDIYCSKCTAEFEDALRTDGHELGDKP